jgi:hypothetical protein
VEDDVSQDAAPEEVADGHDPAGIAGLDALQASAEPRLKRNPLVRLQEKGIEVEHAELPVAGPGLVLAELFE